MFKNRNWLWLILGLIILFLLFYFWQKQSSAVKVKVAEVKLGNVLSTISASGMVDAETVKLGSARMAGRVEWVGVKEGEKVEKGQVLVKFDGYDQAEKEYQRLKKLHAQGFVSDLELERAKTAFDNAQIVAPFSGLITEVSVTPGEAISPGMPVMTLVDIDHPWVEMQIDEVDISRVKVGQKVKFTTDAFPGQEFFGRITWINDRAELKKIGGRVRMDEESLVFRSKVEFEDGRKVLKPGMSVYAEIMIGEKEGVLVIPKEAVALHEGKHVVFEVRGNEVERKEVELGIRDVEKVEVISGLSLGEKVAVSNLDKLKDKTPVKVEF